MTRMNWDKQRRCDQWRTQARPLSDRALVAIASRYPPKKASERQVDYLQSLLLKAGRRKLNREELSLLTMTSASALIKSLSESN